MPPAPTPPKGVRFDATVNLGHVLSAGAFLLAAVIGWADLRADQIRLRDDIGRDRDRIMVLERARERDDASNALVAASVARMAAQIEFLWNAAQRENGGPAR